jgi:hypothetical protein
MLPQQKACKVFLFKPAVISRRLLLLHVRKESCVRGREGGRGEFTMYKYKVKNLEVLYRVLRIP